MTDDRLRTLERAVRASPEDGVALERYDLELSRLRRPTIRQGLTADLAGAIFELALKRDPWKLIMSPCCGYEPTWSPIHLISGFRLSFTANCSWPWGRKRGFGTLRCGRRFLNVTLGPSHTEKLDGIWDERQPKDYTPVYRGEFHTELVRAIIRELPLFHAKGQVLQVSA